MSVPGSFILRSWPSGDYLQVILPDGTEIWTEDPDEAFPFYHADAEDTARTLAGNIEIVRRS